MFIQITPSQEAVGEVERTVIQLVLFGALASVQ